MWPFSKPPKQVPLLQAVAPVFPERTNSRITLNVDGGRTVITDGGPHPPELWAQLTAEILIPARNMAGNNYIEALKLQTAVMQALLPHHTNVQETERERLMASNDHILSDLSPEEFTGQAVTDIVAAAKGTPWEENFNDPDLQALIRQEVGTHFATAQHIERSWHADNNGHIPQVMAWREQTHPGSGEDK